MEDKRSKLHPRPDSDEGSLELVKRLKLDDCPIKEEEELIVLKGNGFPDTNI